MLKIAPLRKKRYPARGARKKAISYQYAHSSSVTSLGYGFRVAIPSFPHEVSKKLQL
jgi:hypothetical protein